MARLCAFAALHDSFGWMSLTQRRRDAKKTTIPWPNTQRSGEGAGPCRDADTVGGENKILGHRIDPVLAAKERKKRKPRHYSEAPMGARNSRADARIFCAFLRPDCSEWSAGVLARKRTRSGVAAPPKRSGSPSDAGAIQSSARNSGRRNFRPLAILRASAALRDSLVGWSSRQSAEQQRKSQSSPRKIAKSGGGHRTLR
jgi:hypothetical protein